ncbi:MAG TPA: hypothetical protein VF522_15695 [Ramlibacter sp.]|uniref:hypothetical protein n=1 Tax=Ramlibacter sp. TaxID=1917967 RepID=UPI002ED4DF84
MDTTTHRYAPPRAEVKDIPDFSDTVAVPRLWNPGAAAGWSLLFTPVFGAALHMRNWKVMGEPAKARASFVWMVASLAAMVLVGLGSVLLPDSRELDRVTNLVGTALVAAWYFASGQAQQKAVKERYGTGYMRKGWGKPLGVAVLACIAYLLAVFVVAFVIGYFEA